MLYDNNPSINSAQYVNNPQIFLTTRICRCADDKGLRNPRKITNFAVSKDGCFERAGTVRFGGANPAKSGFVDLKHNLLTIRYMP